MASRTRGRSKCSRVVAISYLLFQSSEQWEWLKHPRKLPALRFVPSFYSTSGCWYWQIFYTRRSRFDAGVIGNTLRVKYPLPEVAVQGYFLPPEVMPLRASRTGAPPLGRTLRACAIVALCLRATIMTSAAQELLRNQFPQSQSQEGNRSPGLYSSKYGI